MAEDIMTLANELVEVTRLVEADDFGTTLHRFTKRIVRTVPGCAGATISIRSAHAVETVAAAVLDTDAPAELPKNLFVSGPVLEALTFVEPRRLENALSDQRWPAFSAELVNAGYQGCLALPLSTRSPESAVLTLFSRESEQFADIGYDVVLLLTLNAGVVFDNATLYHDSHKMIGQLRAALETRSLVGRAQGLLMRQFGFDSDKAFDTLRRASQNTNTKLRDLAGVLVGAHEDGSFDATVERLAINAAENGH